MSTKLFPIASFIAQQGNAELGQFVGLNLGPGLTVSDQGKLLGLDAEPQTIIAANDRDLVSGVARDLFSVDIAAAGAGDNTWGAKLFFNTECTDGTEVQLREGDANVAVVYKAPAFTTAQALNTTGALSAGTLVVALSWVTVGTVATLKVTATTSLGLPTSFKFRFFIAFMSHDIVTYLP
jgi:hypothetical protein